MVALVGAPIVALALLAVVAAMVAIRVPARVPLSKKQTTSMLCSTV